MAPLDGKVSLSLCTMLEGALAVWCGGLGCRGEKKAASAAPKASADDEEPLFFLRWVNRFSLPRRLCSCDEAMGLQLAAGWRLDPQGA